MSHPLRRTLELHEPQRRAGPPYAVPALRIAGDVLVARDHRLSREEQDGVDFLLVVGAPAPVVHPVALPVLENDHGSAPDTLPRLVEGQTLPARCGGWSLKSIPRKASTR